MAVPFLYVEVLSKNMQKKGVSTTVKPALLLFFEKLLCMGCAE